MTRSCMRVAIVAESFLPNVNGVSNSVLRVIEHLRRTGHEALVIAPDSPRGEPPAERVHDGVRVHRVPSRMFPKVTSLPLGMPRPRMAGVRGFDPDVVHLASRRCSATAACTPPATSARPDRGRIPNGRRGFRRELRHRHRSQGGLGMDAPPAQPRRPHAGAVDVGDGNLAAHCIPRIYRWARGVDITGFAPSARRRAARQWSPDRAHRVLAGRLAGKAC